METKYKIGLAVNVVLTSIGLISNLFGIFAAKMYTTHIAYVCVYICIAIYAFVGYKKPHGNLLKLVMLIFSVAGIFSIRQSIIYNNVTSALLIVVALMLICYIAGRLDKIEKNKFLMVLVLLIFAVAAAFKLLNDANSIPIVVGKLSQVIIWIDICGAYFMRYKQHKEAGLIDREKVKSKR